MKTIIIVLKEEYKQDRNAKVLVIKEVVNYVCAKSRQVCDCSSRTFKFYIITTLLAFYILFPYILFANANNQTLIPSPPQPG